MLYKLVLVLYRSIYSILDPVEKLAGKYECQPIKDGYR